MKRSLARSLFQYVFDSSSLISIERLRHMKVLRRRRNEAIVPEKVAGEVDQPGTPLANFLKRHPEVKVGLSQPEEDKYLEIRRQPGIDDGEAAAIALALNRALLLVIDDVKGRAKAQNHGINCLGWRDFVSGQ